MDHTIDANLVLGTNANTASYNFDNFSGKTLTIAGNITWPLGNSAAAVQFGNAGFAVTASLEYTGGTATSTKPLTSLLGNRLILQIDTAAAELTLSAAITGSSAQGLRKTGAGTVTLTGANSYTGDTAIDAGRLNLAAAGNSARPLVRCS